MLPRLMLPIGDLGARCARVCLRGLILPKVERGIHLKFRGEVVGDISVVMYQERLVMYQELSRGVRVTLVIYLKRGCLDGGRFTWQNIVGEG